VVGYPWPGRQHNFLAFTFNFIFTILRPQKQDIMKRVLFALIVAAMVLPSCKKKPVYMNSATITGIDNATCACCGGYYITIHGSTEQAAKIAALPELDGVNPTYPVFPIELYMNWHKDAGSCNPSEIIIDQAQKK